MSGLYFKSIVKLRYAASEVVFDLWFTKGGRRSIMSGLYMY